jgi:Fe-S-cluster-containing dehydrogenase component/DMSO reductase anchor subunit
LSLLELCLADQADLSAVERFARRHDTGVLPETGWWRDRVPLSRPAPGQQYGFEVDLDACTGCKACVSACRSLNGLDEDESWRTVGLLHGTSLPVQQTVTATCHHCLEPACLAGCPVDAYEKDPVTGIVHHLDDQCIGCGYCTFTCPYDVPRFNPTRGIVRKCDMCAGRLAVGEAPACVQACPNDAIGVTLIDTAEIRRRARDGALVPGAPPSAITVPTTVYRSERGLAPGLVPADQSALRPAPAHPPLAVMLVLTQLSAGAFLVDWCLRALAGDKVTAALGPADALVALGLGLLALGASVLHLGRPRYAWRAVLGLRHSWLSREILAFSAFAALACLYSALLWLGSDSVLVDALGAVVAVAGVAGVACSVMIYAVTRRPFWTAGRTAVRFTLTTAACGLATVLATALTRLPGEVVGPLALLLAGVAAAKLAWEAAFLRHARHADDLGRSARLLTTYLVRLTRWRFGLGLGGGVGIPVLVALGAAQTHPPIGLCAAGAILAAVALVAGELCERTQFFAAVTSPGRTGNLP